MACFRFADKVLDALLGRFAPGSMPPYFIVKTLGAVCFTHPLVTVHRLKVCFLVFLPFSSNFFMARPFLLVSFLFLLPSTRRTCSGWLQRRLASFALPRWTLWQTKARMSFRSPRLLRTCFQLSRSFFPNGPRPEIARWLSRRFKVFLLFVILWKVVIDFFPRQLADTFWLFSPRRNTSSLCPKSFLWCFSCGEEAARFQENDLFGKVLLIVGLFARRLREIRFP
jgi:hypothetical protein